MHRLLCGALIASKNFTWSYEFRENAFWVEFSMGSKRLEKMDSKQKNCTGTSFCFRLFVKNTWNNLFSFILTKESLICLQQKIHVFLTLFMHILTSVPTEKHSADTKNYWIHENTKFICIKYDGALRNNVKPIYIRLYSECVEALFSTSFKLKKHQKLCQ